MLRGDGAAGLPAAAARPRPEAPGWRWRAGLAPLFFLRRERRRFFFGVGSSITTLDNDI
jgi:hypothetical protein